MIECKSISVSLSSREIITDFSACFKNGTITSILGKNGCGKTTLLKAIAGIYACGGHIIIDGKYIKNYKKHELSKSISLMPQVLSYPALPIKKLVEYGRSPYTGFSGILSYDDNKMVDNAILQCGIQHLSSKSLDRISGGERRKAFFAMLLAQNTPNVLLDEPLANLDAEYKQKLIELIRGLKLQNKTVITVFHDINTALEFSDKVIFIDDGKCIFCGTPSQATENEIPEKLFGLKKVSYTEDNKLKYFYH